jgi:hypothetical protein
MRLLMTVLMAFLAIPAWADMKEDALLNKITLRLSAEQWVTTQSALVTVGVNAGTNSAGVEKIQDEVLKKLKDISNQGEWHIISLDHSQDQSGLEKIQISAQARLPSAALANLRDNAKKISKAGETFNVDNILFTPSEEELRAANIQLRNNIYQQARNEIDNINKAYPDQKYYLHGIDFTGNVVTAPMPQNTFVSVRMTQGIVTKDLPVGDKLTIFATVVLAAVPEQLFAKMPH